MTTTIREFVPAQDLDGVAALCRWAWWPERDQAGWSWLTQAPGMAGRPLGWVCAGDDDGEIVGFMGNFIQDRLQGPDRDTAAAVCGHTFVVNPKAMGKARMLMRRILDQGEVAATYTFNANHRSAGFFKHFGFETWPGSGADTKLVWPVAPLTLGAERLLRRWSQARKFAGVQGGREWFAPRPAPAALSLLLTTTRKVPSVRALDPRTDIDARFDDLWRDLLATGASLARRDAGALRWRVADPMLTRPPVLLAYEADGDLAGYLLAVLAKGSEIEAPALEIIDLIARPEVEAVALPALVTALIGVARPLGAARVRLGLAHPRVEALLAPTRPARRQTPYSHCHVRFGRPENEVDRAGWYATPFDGDQSFTARPAPRMA